MALNQNKKRKYFAKGSSGTSQTNNKRRCPANFSERALTVGMVGFFISGLRFKEWSAAREITDIIIEDLTENHPDELASLAVSRAAALASKGAVVTEPKVSASVADTETTQDQQQQQQQQQQVGSEEKVVAETAASNGDVTPAATSAAPTPVQPKSIEDKIAAEVSAERSGADRNLMPLFKASIGVDCLAFMGLHKKLVGKVDVVGVVERLFERLVAEKSARTRYAHRIIPFQAICQANKTEILTTIELLSAKVMGSGASFAVHSKIRYCSHLDRTELVEKIAEVFEAKGHKANLTVPQISIVVEVIRNFAGICVVTGGNYIRLRKFNLHEVYEFGVSDLEKLAETRTAALAAAAEVALKKTAAAAEEESSKTVVELAAVEEIGQVGFANNAEPSAVPAAEV